MNIVRMAQQSDDFESTVWLGTGQSSIRCGKQLEHQAAQCSRCCWDWSMSHCDIKCCCRCGLSCSDFGDNPSNGFLGDFGTLVVVRGHAFVKKIRSTTESKAINTTHILHMLHDHTYAAELVLRSTPIIDLNQVPIEFPLKPDISLVNSH